MIEILLSILISLILALILSEFARKLGLPRVVGQVLAGIILGISFIRPLIINQQTSEIFPFLANLGIILLFYYVGLQTSFNAFKSNMKKSVSISLFNTLLPLIAGFLIMRYIFNFNPVISLIVGISLSVSAQSVSVDLLDELNLLKSKIGSMIISAGAIDDIIELMIITVLLAIMNVSITSLTVTRLLINIFIFVAIIFIARIWCIPYTLKFFDRLKSSTGRFMGAIIIVFLIASLSEFLGIGAIIGAFAAGMLIRQTIYKDVTIPNWEEHDISRSIHIISFGFLIPLFFVWVGLNTQISVILENWLLILILLAIAIVGTVGGTIIAVLLNKGKMKEGLLMGWGLNPKGDVEMVIITLALSFGIISSSLFASLVAMALATTIISPIVFKSLAKKYIKKDRII